MGSEMCIRDRLCVAKAMSGGLAPIGAVIATAPIATSMEENDWAFYSTYGWHPRSVAAAIATLRDLKTNRPRLLAGVAEMSEYFRVRLLQPEFDRPAAVRIQGLAIGIDVGDETTRTPSMTSAAATGCSCRPKDRRCCCCRRWRSTSGRRNSVAGCSGRFPQLAHPCRLITAPGKRASLTEIVDQH